MNDLIVQARAFFESLSRTQRAALIAAVVVSGIAVGGVVWWSSAESYSLVASGDPAQLRRAASKLDEASIPYRYTGAGSGIEVPTASLGEAMVTTASAGFNSWEETFATIDMGTSPSVERDIRTRALESELERTLNSLSAIDASSVHIAPLDRITFIGRDKQASAAIQIHTAASAALDRSQIRGIVRIVAGAVHGLSVDDVTLVDEEGTLLHPNSDAVGLPGGRNLDEVRVLREMALQSNLMDAAEKILGSRDALWATVNVELATSAIERHKNTFDPEGSVLVSENIREEESRDRGNPAGVPGAQTNLPEDAAGAAGGSETEIFENTNNYETSTVQETEIIAPGDVKRVVTSVAVNTDALQPLVTDGMTEDAIRENLRKVIQGAVGFDQIRGDDLVIEFIEFAPAVVAEETSSLSTLTYSLEGLMPSLVSLVAVLLFFLGVVRPIVNKITAVSVVRPEGEQPVEAMVEDSSGLSAGELLDRVQYSLDNDMEPVDPEELNALVEKFMDSSTTVLRRWMKKAS